MAIDVFLIVFYQYDANALRRLEIKYIGGITAITFVPAFVFLFVHTASKGHMYGSVTVCSRPLLSMSRSLSDSHQQLWCAIAPEWVLYRIIFYYAPIWYVLTKIGNSINRSSSNRLCRLVICIVLVLYCLVGWKIVKGKRALQSVESDVIPLDLQQTAEKDDDDHSTNTIGLAVSSPKRVLGAHTSIHGGVNTNTDAGASSSHSGRAWSHDGTESVSPLRPVDDFNSNKPNTSSSPSFNNHKWQANRSALSLRQYLLMPVMFFIVLLVIWVAPTTNRVLSFVEPSFVSFPLYLAVGATGSLRGFWNGIVFLAVGMRSRQSQRRLEAVRPGHYR